MDTFLTRREERQVCRNVACLGVVVSRVITGSKGRVEMLAGERKLEQQRTCLSPATLGLTTSLALC